MLNDKGLKYKIQFQTFQDWEISHTPCCETAYQWSGTIVTYQTHLTDACLLPVLVGLRLLCHLHWQCFHCRLCWQLCRSPRGLCSFLCGRLVWWRPWVEGLVMFLRPSLGACFLLLRYNTSGTVSCAPDCLQCNTYVLSLNVGSHLILLECGKSLNSPWMSEVT